MAEVKTNLSEIEKLKAELEAEKAKNKTLSEAATVSNNRIKELEKAAGVKQKDPKMIQYLVNQTCYWNQTLYHEDDIADIPEGLTPPPEYFEKLQK